MECFCDKDLRLWQEKNGFGAECDRWGREVGCKSEMNLTLLLCGYQIL